MIKKGIQLMSKKSFFKYIMQKINEKFTIVTKILLVVSVVSSFIPLPIGQVDNLNTFQTFMSLYLAFIMLINIILMFTLMMLYMDFRMYETNDETILLKEYLFIIIAPIVSISISLIFGILTPFQIGICLPTIVFIVIYVVELMSKINIDTRNIEKIFFKK